MVQQKPFVEVGIQLISQHVYKLKISLYETGFVPKKLIFWALGGYH